MNNSKLVNMCWKGHHRSLVPHFCPFEMTFRGNLVLYALLETSPSIWDKIYSNMLTLNINGCFRPQKWPFFWIWSFLKSQGQKIKKRALWGFWVPRCLQIMFSEDFSILHPIGSKGGYHVNFSGMTLYYRMNCIYIYI